jgi:hypothetical protein
MIPMPRMRGLLAAILISQASLIAVTAARAEDQLVYWPLVTDGNEYRRVAYPGEAGDLVVLADTTIVLEARAAPVTYWPITREFIAGVSRSSPLIEASVEIVAETGEATVVEPAPYIVWHPDGVGAGPTELLTGDAATAAYENYVRGGREAAIALQQYQRIVAEHHAAVEAWLKIAAQRPASLPPPPPELDVREPEPYRAFATDPQQGAVVTLPAGHYTVRLRDSAGDLVAGSERSLVSFAPLRQGIGYVVRPGDRWTQPVVSFSPDETVYITGRSDLFVQPVPVAEFQAHRFTRLFRPQSVEAADPFLTVWVPQPPKSRESGAADLAVWNGDTQVSTLATTPYRVSQTTGQARGYVIEEFQSASPGGLQPDFFAMRLDGDVPVTRVSLVNDAPVPASERRFRRVHQPGEAWLFVAVLVPLLAGLGLRLVSRLSGDRKRRRTAAGSSGPHASRRAESASRTG